MMKLINDIALWWMFAGIIAVPFVLVYGLGVIFGVW